MTDWGAQHEWMLGTHVRAEHQEGRGVGGVIAAFTGIGQLGFWDTMTITGWEEPRIVEVDHTGDLVKGIGISGSNAGSGSRFVWREEVDLPLGWAGDLGWHVVKPILAAGVALSLRRFARFAVRT